MPDNRYTHVTYRIELDGNFFRRDPRKTVKGNIRKMMEAMAPEAERLVKDQISGRAGSMPYYTSWTHDSVIGRAGSIAGKSWAATMVVSANTSGMSRGDAIRTKAAASGIERRWHPFRRVASALRRSRAVLAANLVEGLE